MRRTIIKTIRGIIVVSCALTIVAALWVVNHPTTVLGANYQQQATPLPPVELMATVTGTAFGPYIIVNSDNDQINVRECPNATTCSKIGVLLAGQKAAAKGRSSGGVWIQIEYPGVPGGLAWVHSSLVSLFGGGLPVVEPPDTPTPRVTATIDPTLAAQFIVTILPTRLPTYTQPAPLVITTFEDQSNQSLVSNVPMGMIIFGLAALGVFGALLSVLQGR